MSFSFVGALVCLVRRTISLSSASTGMPRRSRWLPSASAALVCLGLVATPKINAQAVRPLSANPALSVPRGIAVDSSGNVFVADSNGGTIREIFAATNYATSQYLAGSTSIFSPFGQIFQMALDSSGNLWVADNGDSTVFEFTKSSGYATAAIANTSFIGPAGIAVDSHDNVFVSAGATVFEMTLASNYNTVTTLAPAYNDFYLPYGLAVDSIGNVFVTDWANNEVKEITPSSNYQIVSILAQGTSFNFPYGIVVEPGGDVIVANGQDASVVNVLEAPGYSTVSTLNVNALDFPFYVALDTSGNLFITDNSATVKETLAGVTVSAVSPNSGLTTGGTPVTITGTNFASGATVTFGNTPATSVTFNNTGSITAISPTGTGTVNLTVTTGAGTSFTSTNDRFTYTGPLVATLEIQSEALTEGISASFTPVTGSGGTGALSYSISPALPTGLNIDPATGTISGTRTFPYPPTAFMVTVTDSNNDTAEASFTLTVNSVLTATQEIASQILFQNEPATPFTPVAGGDGTPPLSYSVIPALPSGLSLNTSNGQITGTPTVTSSATAYTVVVTDANGATATNTFSLTVLAAPNYVVNTTVDDSGTATNCTPQSSTTSNTTDSACSLRDALLAAANAGAGIIYFDSSNVFLASNSFARNTITLSTTGTLTIPSNTAIYGATAGNGANLTNLVTVDGDSGKNGQFSIFTVNFGTNSTAIGNLTIAHGTGTNTGIVFGGGIYNNGTLAVTDSTFSGNSATGGGGAIYTSGTLTVTGSTFSSNSVVNGVGGAIFTSGTLTVTGSTFSGNSTGAGGEGGAIVNASDTLTVTNSTFSGNSAGTGGAIFNPGIVTVTNTIFTGDTGGECEGNNCPTASGESNIIDPTGVQANLARLSNYGGPTQTMIPLPGNPAICAGAAANIPFGATTDQRGEPNTNRSYPGYNANSPCVDAGAVQTNYAIGFTQQPSNVTVNEAMSPAVTLTESSTAASFVSGDNVTVTDADGYLSSNATANSALSSGVATFSGLLFSTAVTGNFLTASLPLTSSLALTVNSDAFDIDKNSTTVTANNAIATYSAGAQIATLSATVNSTAGAVDAGTIAFTVFNGGTPVGTVTTSGTVSGGSASVNYTLPAGTLAGVYTIQVVYSGSANFAVSTDSTHTLTVQAPTATQIVVSGYPSPAYVGTAYTGTVTVEDALGNTVSTYSGSATITTTDNAATITTPIAIANGNGTFTATFATSGTQSITAAVSGLNRMSETGIQVDQAPSFVVETATDDPSGVAANCPVGGGSTCTLRDALTAAANAGGANITFVSSAFPAPNGAAITLGTTGTLTIPSNTTIEGLTTGSGTSLQNLVTVNGTGGSEGQFSVFTVNSGTTAAIDNLTILNGSGSSFNAVISGGGILNNGTLMVTGGNFVGNSSGSSGEGGAIFNGGTLTVAGSTFSGNSAGEDGGGGAIWNSGTLSVTNSSFSGNSSAGGGAIDNSNTGTLTVTGSTFFGNSMGLNDEGGAILNNGALIVADSTFSGNSGGDRSAGGAIYNTAVLTVTNSTFSVNSAGSTGTGGGIDNIGTLTVTSSVFTQDTDGECSGSGCPVNGTNGNIVDPPTGTLANLAPLGNYGGPTQTLLPLPGSAAICAGSYAAAQSAGISADQRGVAFGNTGSGNYCPSGSIDAGAVQTDYSMVFTANPPSVVPPNTNFSAAVTVEESGNALKVGSASVELSLIGAGTLTGGGSSPVTLTTTNGVASSSSLQVNTPGGPDLLQASLTLTAATPATLSASSLNFTVTSLSTVTEASNATATFSAAAQSLTLTATVTGSGGTVNAGAVTFTVLQGATPIGTASGMVTNGQAAAIFTLPAGLGVGTYTIEAVYNGSGAFTNSSDTSHTLTITAAAATVQLSNLTQTYTGLPLAVTAATTPAGLAVSITYDGSTTAPTNAESYAVVATITSAYFNGSATGTLKITQAALNLTANNTTKTYGTVNPIFTGSVTGAQNGDTFTESFSTKATVSSPVASYAIVPSATGANLADYMLAVSNGTLSVTQAASTTTVGLSSATITPGQNETITATVASTTTGTPTGTVSFYDGTTLLSAATLSSGTASYSTTTLAAGITHVITATYSGDTNFTGSTSVAITSITVGQLDFTIAISGPSNASAMPGQSITYQATVTPLYGSYPGTVSFSVSGLPSGASVTFSPSSIAADSGPQTISATIATASATAAGHTPPPSETCRIAPVALAFLALIGMGAVRRCSRALRRLLSIVVLLAGGAVATLVSGCGGTSGFFAQAAQNYTITITATAGTIQHSTNVTLDLQ